MKPHQLVNTRQRVAELHAKGLGTADIAKLLDISRQRVYQHLDRIKQAGIESQARADQQSKEAE